jgi:hypothetical protein
MKMYNPNEEKNLSQGSSIVCLWAVLFGDRVITNATSVPLNWRLKLGGVIVDEPFFSNLYSVGSSDDCHCSALVVRSQRLVPEVPLARNCFPLSSPDQTYDRFAPQ